MNLSKHEQAVLAKRIHKRRNPSRTQQIYDYPGRVVGVSTADARMRKWDMSLHEACTTPTMNNQ